MQIYKYFNNQFFPYALKEKYQVTGIWPDRGVDIDENIFAEYSGLSPAGKMCGTNNNGMPTWLDEPALSPDELIAIVEQNRQQLIDKAMLSISVIQLKLQAGRALTDVETMKLNTALDYIDTVNAVDTSTAPNVNWPVLAV